VGRPLAFISHSSEDSAVARAIAEILRQRGIDPWLDHERIRPGDSIPGRIEEGISGCDVILVLISESFVRSRWCRAEYEPLLSREIESGRTLVIPIRLDDAQIPSLLSAKKYTDVRDGIGGAAMEELAETILDGHGTAVIGRLLRGNEAAKQANYGYSLLSMIISKVIGDYPAVAVSREKILQGKSILDLYRTVETLIMHYEDLCDEIIDLVGDTEDEGAYDISHWRIQRANRRLLDIANDMRDIARSLDGIVEADSPLHRRLAEVLELCTQISQGEVGLLIMLGAPSVLPDRPLGYASLMGQRSPGDFRREKAQFPFESHQALGQPLVAEMERLLGELNSYKVQLRSAVAVAREEP
jgi:TIR domain